MKILIIGHPGSGKTFLADKLRRKTGIETIDIDVLFDKHPFYALSKEMYRRKILKLIGSRGEWIIDGYHIGLIPLEIKRQATVIIFLNLPKVELRKNILKRYSIKKQSSEFSHWQGSYLNNLKCFIQIRLQDKRMRREVEELKNKKSSGASFIEIHSRTEIDRMLKTFTVKSPAPKSAIITK